MNDRQWAMLMHFSLLARLPGIMAGFIIWRLKRNDSPEIDAHGKVIINWASSMAIYYLVALVLVLLLIGKPLPFFLVGMPILLVLVGLSIVFPIVGGIKANNGEVWKYPLSISFFK